MPALIRKMWQEANPDTTEYLELKIEMLSREIKQLEHRIAESLRPTKLTIAESQGHRFIDTAEILYIQAKGNYSTICLANGSMHLISKTLKALHLSLPEGCFIRCHASYLVNKNHVRKTPDTTSMELISGDIIPISRRKYQYVIERLSTSI